jgi:hypothetical protein
MISIARILGAPVIDRREDRLERSTASCPASSSDVTVDVI